MTTATDRREIDAYAVALDETADYNIDLAHRPYIRRILGAYLFDRNEHTHCCELTASYYLIFLFTSVELTDAGLALDDDARGELYDRYESEPSDERYVHCREIDRILEAAEPYRVCHYGDVAPNDLEDGIEDADERHAAEMECIREHLSCNHPF
jgi:hypothetical protein